MYQRVYFINSIIIIFKCELFIYIYSISKDEERSHYKRSNYTHTKKNNFVTQQDDRRNPVKYNFIRLTFVRRPIIIHGSL